MSLACSWVMMTPHANNVSGKRPSPRAHVAVYHMIAWEPWLYSAHKACPCDGISTHKCKYARTHAHTHSQCDHFLPPCNVMLCSLTDSSRSVSQVTGTLPSATTWKRKRFDLGWVALDCWPCWLCSLSLSDSKTKRKWRIIWFWCL